MGRKKRERTRFWKDWADRLDQDARVEQPEPPQKPGGEKLDVNVIHLNYRDQARTIGELLDLFWPANREVDGKAEEVLTVWVAADGMIVKLAPPPGSYFPRLLPDHPENTG